MHEHRTHCSLPFTPDQLFDLVADVERYPEFLPWWVAARVCKRRDNVYYTDQVLRIATIRRRFGSKTVLERPKRIRVTSTDGPVRNLHLIWSFDPRSDRGCDVSLEVRLDFRSLLLSDLFALDMVHAARPIMAAFQAHAYRLYGTPCNSDVISDGPGRQIDMM